MSVLGIVFWLSLFWACVHSLPSLLHRLRRRHTLLPAPLSTRSRSALPGYVSSNGATTLTVDTVHLRVESTALNARHDALAARLGKARFRRILAGIYDVGTVAGVLGMLAADGALCWTGWQFGRALVQGTVVQQPMHAKRAIEGAMASVRPSAGADIHLQLLIPGLTVPLSHLPVLLLSLFISQVIHEAGHAICAALDAVPLHSVGASLSLAIPSAFVALPASTLRALAPRSRARIAAAGALHNIVFWLALCALARVGFNWLGAYEDVTAHARIVLDVDADSPLYSHLPAGAVIVALDDVGAERWDAYLTAPASDATPGLGWCAREMWFLDHGRSCCDNSEEGALACFVSAKAEQRCVDPVPLLVPVNESVARCGDETHMCGVNEVCVRPRERETLLRIGVSSEGTERVILWRGPKVEVWEQVEVGTWLPRWRMLPLWLPHLTSTFLEYLKALTLSLFFLNVLPLPRLDGSQLLDAVLEYYDGDDGDLEDLEVGRGRRGERGRWKRRIGRSMRVMALTLVGGCLVLGLCGWAKEVWS